LTALDLTNQSPPKPKTLISSAQKSALTISSLIRTPKTDSLLNSGSKGMNILDLVSPDNKLPQMSKPNPIFLTKKKISNFSLKKKKSIFFP